MMSTQHGIDGEVAAAVQLLDHFSSVKIAPENGVVDGQLFSSSDSAPTKATCCDLNFTTSVTASTTAPSTSSRFGGELNGPTTQNVVSGTEASFSYSHNILVLLSGVFLLEYC